MSSKIESESETPAEFFVHAGLAVRGLWRAQIRREAFTHGLTCKIEEERGWFGSDYYITVSGPPAALESFSAWFAVKLGNRRRRS